MGILNSEMDRERKQHSDEIARLEERILYLEEKHKWIPVIERLPEDPDQLILFCTRDYIVIGHLRELKDDVKVKPDREFGYWMPLPETPYKS